MEKLSRTRILVLINFIWQMSLTPPSHAIVQVYHSISSATTTVLKTLRENRGRKWLRLGEAYFFQVSKQEGDENRQKRDIERKQ